jgi:hypothetical protein
MAQFTAHEFSRHLENVPPRLIQVVSFYLLALAVKAPRHTQSFASELSGLDKSQFSRLLSGHQELAMESLQQLSIQSARAARSRQGSDPQPLIAGTPWRTAVIIDSTLHRRSSCHIHNAQRFNHGAGFSIGHQWTNVVLVVGDELIALDPIAFLTKNECKRRKVHYRTEHEQVREYLEKLDLTQYLGHHDPAEVVVLTDSGYDNKTIQNTILGRGWDFVGALKSNRSAKTCHADPHKSLGFCQIRELFSRVRRYAPSETVRIDTAANTKKKKRKTFRVRRIEGYIRGVEFPVVLICSKKKKGNDESQKKYLTCSNLTIESRAILMAFSLRWQVELFHRATKQNLGMCDAGVPKFESVHSHVRWVYCAYLLLAQMNVKEGIGIQNRQEILAQKIEAEKLRTIIQLSTRFHGARQVRLRCQEVLHEFQAAAA